MNAEQFSTNIGTWLLNNFEPVLPYITRFVYFIELYGPLAIIAPFALLYFRLPVLFLLICMHIGFALCLNVGLFPYVSICSLLLFLPKEIWNSLGTVKLLNRDHKLKIFYDKNCDFCLKTVLILKNLLILPRVKVNPAQDDKKAGPLLLEHDSWVVQTSENKYLFKWAALTYIVGRSPIFFWLRWPLLWLSKINLGDHIYTFIGNRRQYLSGITQRFFPWRDSPPMVNYKLSVVVIIFFFFVLYLNLRSIAPNTFPPQANFIYDLKYTTGVWQKWNMFAPNPVKVTRWPIFEGTTINGQKVDVFRQTLGEADRSKPESLLSEYNYYRWRKYYSRLYSKKYRFLRQAYVDYQCKHWNSMQSSSDVHLESISLQVAIERTRKNRSKEKYIVKQLGHYNCKN